MAETSLKVIIPPELPALIKRLSDSERVLAANEAAIAFSPVLTRALVEESQERAGSGPFAKGWLATPLEGQPGMQVLNSYGKAAFIEFPTKPHVIKPKRASVLAWMPGRGAFSAFFVKAGTKARAGWAFAKQVNHPGTAGKFVFKHTIEKKVPELFSYISKEAKKFLTGS